VCLSVEGMGLGLIFVIQIFENSVAYMAWPTQQHIVLVIMQQLTEELLAPQFLCQGVVFYREFLKS